jgi:purine-nucleoside/S-methyl-5'-thioadenosine phosphorylase / adenosine deaminase
MLPKPNDGFAWVQAQTRPALVCRDLQPLAEHLFTTRSWALGSAGAAQPDEAWEEVAGAMRVDPRQLVRVRQVHGAEVVVLRRGEARDPDRVPADVIVSDDPSLALAIQTADCVPLLIADRRTGAVAAAHAGWRGLSARVPEVAVNALARDFGSRPSDLVAAVGPSIAACCYEVGADVREAFTRAGFAASELDRWFSSAPRPSTGNQSMPGLPHVPRANHWFFDGWAAARHQLDEAGVPAHQIHIAELCTASHPEILCSYRRDGKAAGRIAGVIRPPQRLP